MKTAARKFAEMNHPDTLEIRRKRALYRAQHRGTQEMDILIGGFVADGLDTFDHAFLDRLETLMDREETELQAWLMGQAGVPPDVDGDLIAMIRTARETKVRP